MAFSPQLFGFLSSTTIVLSKKPNLFAKVTCKGLKVDSYKTLKIKRVKV